MENAIREGTAIKKTEDSGAPEPEFTEIPVTGMRKIIASRLVLSKAPIPHFYLTIDANMEEVVARREALKKETPNQKISYNDIVLRITALTLSAHPIVNACLENEIIRQYRRVHLGFAVALEDGLITPVIRNSDKKGIAELSKEVAELSERARQRKLRRQEYEGATFTVSNLGMFGIEHFSAIINPPQGAILAVGSIEKRPVAVGDEIKAQYRMKATISCDHRVMDGAQAAVFMKSLKHNLENPASLPL